MTKRETDLEIFAKLCRYNSGRHFLDSGGDYGRHFEKPAIGNLNPGQGMGASPVLRGGALPCPFPI
jgi:hypothetical protein